MFIEEKVETLEQKVSELSNKILKLEEKNNELKNERLYSTNEAAAKFGISRSTLLFHIRNGTIKVIRGSISKFARCKLSQAEIEHYIERKIKHDKLLNT